MATLLRGVTLPDGTRTDLTISDDGVFVDEAPGAGHSFASLVTTATTMRFPSRLRSNGCASRLTRRLRLRIASRILKA